jgi:hypothetical protein
MKEMTLDVSHDDLVHMFGKDVVAYSTMTKYVHSAQFAGRKEATTPEAPDVKCSPVDEAILTALAEFPFLFLFPFPFPFSCARAFAEGLSSKIHYAPAPEPHPITSFHAATSSMGPHF